MFRRPSGGFGFSFNRLITNAVPNFANDNPQQDADLSWDQKDMLWTHQVSEATTGGSLRMALDSRSALMAGVTTSDTISGRVYNTLLKIGILSATHPIGIDTTRITPKFAHQLAFISVAAQRKVIGMLFFWEEEVVRWRLLDQEEAEIRTAMEGGELPEDVKEELRVRLESVRMKKGMKPSERTAEGGGHDQQGGGPPQYER